MQVPRIVADLAERFKRQFNATSVYIDVADWKPTINTKFTKPTQVSLKFETRTECQSWFVSATMRFTGQLTEEDMELVEYNDLTSMPKMVIFGSGKHWVCYPDITVNDAMERCKKEHPHLIDGSFEIRRIDGPVIINGTITDDSTPV